MFNTILINLVNIFCFVNYETVKLFACGKECMDLSLYQGNEFVFIGFEYFTISNCSLFSEALYRTQGRPYNCKIINSATKLKTWQSF
jgi:hypothetical protein